MISIQELEEVDFPLIDEEPGLLAVYQSPDTVGFAIQRVFCVRAGSGALRGQHAHKACSQLLVALSGQVRLSCTDGTESKTFVLRGMGKGVLIPPMIWAEQVYEEENSVLMVICDRPYEAADYIRDFGEFLAYRKFAEPARMEAVSVKVLISGALGHIGSHLIRALPATLPGIEIVMIDNMMTQRYASLFELPTQARYSFVEGDVARIDLKPLLKGCDLAIALAAITDAANSFANAAVVEANNLSATRALAEACAASGVPMLFPSSTSVYGTQAEVIDDDCSDDVLLPQSPYARTKLAEEQLIAEWVATRGLRAIICRFGTIYGVSPGMRFHTAVNKFCWQAVLDQPITVWTGAYDQKRPYLDLRDCGLAVRFILENKLFDGRVYNVVTANHTVREVVETIRSYVPQLQVSFVDSPIMNQLSYEVRASRLRERGFAPCGGLKAGIGDTVFLLGAANGGAQTHRAPPPSIDTRLRASSH